MSLAATYVSTTSFTVTGDLTTSFPPGRAVRCDCGADGPRYGFVDYSSYSAETTVNLLASESEALTNNLVTVEFSTQKPDSINTGSAPLEDILMLRGFKTGMALEYKDADEFYVGVGSIHIDDGTYDRIYQVPSKLTKSVTGLSASTWYHVYAAPPANGLTLTATEITYSTTAPSVDDTKGGKLYHPSDGTKRCIGWFYSFSDSTILEFRIYGNTIYRIIEIWPPEVAGNGSITPGNTWTTLTCNIPIGGIAAYFRLYLVYSNTGIECYIREKGATNQEWLTHLGNTYTNFSVHIFHNTSSLKQVEMKFNSATNNTIWPAVKGFIIPSSL